MRYVLNEEYALRSFIGVPHGYYRKGVVNLQRLSREEYDFLRLCDGEHEQAAGQSLPEGVLHMVHPAAEGETIQPRQRPRYCDNRYFPALNWMLTGKCNYNCRHCFNAADFSPLAAEWSWEDALILMDEAASCGINAFTITGGEPTLHPHFLDIIRGIHARGMFVNELNTNGAFLTQDMLHEFERCGARPLIKISFDGLGWHDWLRNCKGAEEKTLAAIRLCTQAGLPVKVQYNVHRKNIGTVPETLACLESIGVKETRIIRTTEAPRWAQLGRGLTLSFREYYEQMLAVTEGWLQSPHTMAVTIWHMAALPLVTKEDKAGAAAAGESEWDKLTRFRRESYICPDCRFLAAVTADGDLVPCMQMSGLFSQEGTRLGNVKGGGLQKFLREGAYLDTVCITLGDLLKENAQCRECNYFLDCLGGCRGIALLTEGDYMGTDPARCIYYKEGYAKRLDELVSQLTPC